MALLLTHCEQTKKRSSQTAFLFFLFPIYPDASVGTPHLRPESERRGYLLSLEFQVRHGLVHRFDGCGWSGSALVGARRVRPPGHVRTASRFVNLQIDSSIVLHAHHAQECANGLGRVARASDNLTHIFGMHI